MAKFICGTNSDRVSQALFDAGIVKEDPRDVRRIVIDLQVNHPAMIYVEKFVDDTLADVLLEAGIADLQEAAAA